MVPERRTNESWLPEIFNDFFDNRWMERVNYSAPAINVKENEKEYVAAETASGGTPFGRLRRPALRPLPSSSPT